MQIRQAALLGEGGGRVKINMFSLSNVASNSIKTNLPVRFHVIKTTEISFRTWMSGRKLKYALEISMLWNKITSEWFYMIVIKLKVKIYGSLLLL